MPRLPRLESAGAWYHVINRGNYRRDLFESAGAAEAFLKALSEAAGKFSWRLFAYALMRNHFHLAIETKEATLGQGMHWLQSTMATRFNRLRSEHGHLFQGRYKSLLIEDDTALARVVDYIHLNPVRAKVVNPEMVTAYRWSSLHALIKGTAPAALAPAVWLEARGGWQNTPDGYAAYADWLRRLAGDEAAWEREGVVGLASGWAIGSAEWRKEVATEREDPGSLTVLSHSELKDLREARWQRSLDEILARRGRSLADFQAKPRQAEWKVGLAGEVRDEAGASIAWLARRMSLTPATLRAYLCRKRKQQNTG